MLQSATPITIFPLPLQPLSVLGSGFDLSWSRDVIGHVTIWFPMGYFLLVVLLEPSLYRQMWRNGWHVLKRPL